MKANGLVGIVLIVGGILAIVYGGFSYTKDTHSADIGGLHLSLSEKERVNIPLWAGIAAIVAGGLLFGTSRRP